jgi:Pyridoxamine 5'-phosphate oxidase
VSARAVGWKAFSVDAPELAETGRALLEQFGPGLAFLATVRADGAPRLHPVCPVLSAERLFVLITAASPKRRDLERDGRYALQTFPQPNPGSDEFYIAGTATVVEDARIRARIFADAKHRSEPSEIAFELSLERVVHTRGEHPLTPEMYPVHRTWRASDSG